MAYPKAEREKREYLEIFHQIVTGGITCGLDHPIEWWINAYRTPGGTLNQEYYFKLMRHAKKYFTEMYECIHLRSGWDDEVLGWLLSFYPSTHHLRNQFNEILEAAFNFNRKGDEK